MRLTSNPKPVRFRIMSGGEEHSSLDSLRHNFCLSDLQQIEKQLLSWLKRQGKEGEDIAQELEKMPKCLSKCTSLEDFFLIYKIFFKNIIPSLSASNDKMSKWPCFRETGSLKDIYKWFEKNEKYKKDLKSLETILWGVDEEYSLSIIKRSNDLEKHIDVLKKFSSANAFYMLGKYYCDHHDYDKGLEFLLKAEEKGMKEASQYVEMHIRKITEKPKNIDVPYIKEYIERRVYYKSYIEEDIMHNWTDEEKIVIKFVHDCVKIQSESDAKARYEKAKELFYVNSSIIDDFLYRERQFIIYMFGRRIHEYEEHCKKQLENLSNIYYPAKYLITPTESNAILDAKHFRGKGSKAKIDILLLNLFEF